MLCCCNNGTESPLVLVAHIKTDQNAEREGARERTKHFVRMISSTSAHAFCLLLRHPAARFHLAKGLNSFASVAFEFGYSKMQKEKENGDEKALTWLFAERLSQQSRY